MDPICLLVAGALRATLPTSEFTLRWEHSVQKSAWQEQYRVEGNTLVLAEARIESNGAGMEPPDGAVLKDGGWSWRPGLALPALTLTRSSYAADYRLCWQGACRELGALVGPTPEGTAVVVQPCAAVTRSPG